VSAQPAERLEKTLARVAREQGLDQERLRRWVSFLALCGVLEQAVQQGVIDTYYLKGGVAMELRFARVARTTKDFDLGLAGNRAERIRQLEEVLKLGFDAFTFRLKPEIHQMELADTARVEVAVQYKGPGEAREVDMVAPIFCCWTCWPNSTIGERGRRRSGFSRSARRTLFLPVRHFPRSGSGNWKL